MGMVGTLIYKIAQLFIIMLIGFLLTKWGLIKSQDSTILSKLSLYLLMPCSIINAFDFEMTPDIRNGLILAFAAAFIIHFVFFILDFVYKKTVSKNSVERASIMYTNAGNLVIPIVSFVLGEEWVLYTAAYLSAQMVFMWTHCIGLFSNQKFNIKKIIFNVNIIVIFIGFALMLSGLRLPEFVKGVTTSFSSMMGTVGMLIAGIMAANIDYKKILPNKRIYLVAIFRMIVWPVIMLVIVKLLSLFPVMNADKVLLVPFLASIAPSAATIMQFGQLYNKDPDFAVGINLVTTLSCIVTMPIFVALFNLI